MNHILSPLEDQHKEAGQSTKQDSFKNQSGIREAVVSQMLRRLLRRCGDPPVCLTLPSGRVVNPDITAPVATIQFHDYRSLASLLIDPFFQFGEAYASGKIDVQGDLVECMACIFRCTRVAKKRTNAQSVWNTIRRPNHNTRKGSKENIHHHYDLGNEFYRLWLDENLVYTCAYYAEPDVSLEQAQLAKMDHVCRKLRLRPGQSVVEAGCGWGSLAMHMAENYGVKVKAYNISKEQVAEARRRAKSRGLARQVEFVLDDWRNIQGKYDAFASVGMLEHVGVKNYKLLGETIDRCLIPDGLSLIHSIGQNHPIPLNTWIERRIFPGAYPPTIEQMMQIFVGADFQVLDIENLRLHYAQTLRHWLQRFDAAENTVRQEFDDRFVKMWRIYLAGSVAAFQTGCLQLFQVVVAKGASNNVPRTREHIYQAMNGQTVGSDASNENGWGS